MILNKYKLRRLTNFSETNKNAYYFINYLDELNILHVE